MENDTASRFQNDGDGELLRLIASQPDSACEAQEEFYQRHVRYMYGVSRRAFSDLLGPDKIEDVVQDTFVRVFTKAGTFSFDESMDLSGQRRAVRAWMGKIMDNIVMDYFRGQPEIHFVDEETLDSYDVARAAQQGEPREGDGSVSRSQELLEDAFDTLTEDEKHVLRVTAFWYKPGQKQQKLPQKVMAELTESLHTNATNVRKIRSRGVAKIREYFESH